MEIETTFSRLLQYINIINFDTYSFGLFPGFEATVKQLVKALFARNPNNVNEIVTNLNDPVMHNL